MAYRQPTPNVSNSRDTSRARHNDHNSSIYKTGLGETEVIELRRLTGVGEQKSTFACEFGMGRGTLCQYSKVLPTP
jgi:hypothetical protein